MAYHPAWPPPVLHVARRWLLRNLPLLAHGCTEVGSIDFSNLEESKKPEPTRNILSGDEPNSSILQTKQAKKGTQPNPSHINLGTNHTLNG